MFLHCPLLSKSGIHPMELLQGIHTQLHGGLQTVLVKVKFGVVNGAGGIRTNAHIGANSSVLLYLGQHYGGVIRTADIALKIYCLEPGHLFGRPLDNLHHGIVAGACGHLSVIHIVILEVVGLCSALQNIEDPLARVFGKI